jgi:SAM-dependent methyltransferase
MTGIQGEGLDVSADAARAARDLYGITVHPLDIAEAGFPPDAFDLITMFHVLEHLPRPREALLKILSWLAPEGVLLVQVPNLNSYQARLFGPRWIGIDIPRHLVNFTPAGLRRLLEGTGFSPGAASFYSLRDNAPAIVSSLAPSLDPVAMAIRGNTRFASARRLFYFGLVLLAQPLALLESLLGKGGTMFLVAKKES